MSALLHFGRFEMLRLIRSWKFLLITVGFPVTFYMLFLGDRRSGEVVAAGSVTWREYLMVAMCSFGCLVAGLTAGGGRLAAERVGGWARQLRVTPLPTWSYVMVKTATSMLVMLPVIVLVEVVSAGFGDVRLAAGRWIELTLVMWVTGLPFAELGVLIGFVAGVETAFPVITALMFVLGYFGGLFNPVSAMPSPLRTAAHLLPSFHGAAAGLSVVDGGPAGVTDWLILAGYAVGLSALVAWRHRTEEMKGLA